MDSFDLMPLSCIVNGKFLALHGGISPELKTVIIDNKGGLACLNLKKIINKKAFSFLLSNLPIAWFLFCFNQ